MDYMIVLETFEGPMDLLLHLIDEAKIDIYDIPINMITEQYMEYLKKMEKVDLGITGEFLIMAATLLEIKSKMLLPEPRGGEDGNITKAAEDPRLELSQRLAEYRMYKLLTNEFRQMESIQSKIFYKPQEDWSNLEYEDKSFEQLDLHGLIKVYKELLDKEEVNKIVKINRIQRETDNLENCIKKIKGNLNEGNEIRFRALLGDKPSKENIIMIFLALLELIRTKYITIYQENNFADIFISRAIEEGV